MIHLKTEKEIKIMQEGGAKLGLIRDALRDAVAAGVSAWDIEELANDLIDKSGGRASFKMVENYSWATCVNVNDGIVHGIPKKETVFKDGDVVSVDVGLYYKGFHTDTSVSVGVNVDSSQKHFLMVGKKALAEAIKQAKPGNRISDISKQMQSITAKNGYSVVTNLVGHGVGKELHEDPQIPCFVDYEESRDLVLPEGLVIAIEIMYTAGSPKLKLSPDKWTIVTVDGKISGLFEETVAVTKNGPIILTEQSSDQTRVKKG